VSGFDDRFSIHRNTPGQYKRLRFGARGNQIVFNEILIEPNFRGRG
jgi:hypothetical protein